jgi:hypothetical protein
VPGRLCIGGRRPRPERGDGKSRADHGILLLSPLLGPVPEPIVQVITAYRAAVEHFTFIACIEPVIGQVKALLP